MCFICLHLVVWVFFQSSVSSLHAAHVSFINADEIHSVPIDNVYNIKDIQTARERQKDPKKSGRVVIKVGDGW